MHLTLRTFAVVELKEETKMLQEICDFMIIDTVVVKAPTDEFGASDLDLDSRRVGQAPELSTYLHPL
jgi:hypothetical protein